MQDPCFCQRWQTARRTIRVCGILKKKSPKLWDTDGTMGWRPLQTGKLTPCFQLPCPTNFCLIKHCQNFLKDSALDGAELHSGILIHDAPQSVSIQVLLVSTCSADTTSPVCTHTSDLLTAAAVC